MARGAGSRSVQRVVKPSRFLLQKKPAGVIQQALPGWRRGGLRRRGSDGCDRELDCSGFVADPIVDADSQVKLAFGRNGYVLLVADAFLDELLDRLWLGEDVHGSPARFPERA